ncbi:MAG: M48 family metallopeptidase [Thermodesulfovibrionales bacterium]
MAPLHGKGWHRPAGHFSRAVAVLAMAAFLASCAVSPITGEPELMLVSEADEISIGREAAPSLNWTYGGRWDDPELNAYLSGIVGRLWQNSERPGLPMEFALQNSSVPNAFALPGYVAITRGLLAEMESEAQFAAVMGHEVGHVMARHTAKRITQLTLRQLGLALGGTLLSGSKEKDLILGVGALSSSLLLLKYSRENELEADRLGVRYMAELGYDPGEAISAHQRLQAAVEGYRERLGVEDEGGSLLGAILSTHPRDEVRIEEIQAMIRGLPPGLAGGGAVRRDVFLQKTARLREANKAYYPYDKAAKLYGEDRLAEAEALLKEALAKDGRQPAFHHLYGMIMLKREGYAGAHEHFNRALAIDPGYQPSVYGRGLAFYRQERYGEALPSFRRSLELFPGHPGSLFGAGASHFRLRDYREAVPYLKEFASQSPSHPQVHGMLGICHEASGDVPSAVSEYQLQLRVAPDNEMGRHARARLLSLGGAPVPK